MEKIINNIINSSVEGCDVYHHKGSTWLIFTDTKQWVIELTEERTLWYNYHFFNNLFSYVSMDVVENENYITKWVENTIINGIQGINYMKFYPNALIKNVVEKGVQEPLRVQDLTEGEVEEVIEFGVKETNSWNESIVGDLNQNGCIDNVIENGVKEMIDDVIENGVKKTHGVSKNLFWEIGDTIQNGVKKTISRENPSTMVDDIIKKTKADASQNPMGKVTEVLKDGKVSQ